MPTNNEIHVKIDQGPVVKIRCFFFQMASTTKIGKEEIIYFSLRGLSQITFALRVGRWSEKCVVYYIKSAN